MADTIAVIAVSSKIKSSFTNHISSLQKKKSTMSIKYCKLGNVCEKCFVNICEFVVLRIQDSR